MSHLDEDDLMTAYYENPPDRVTEHLAECAECRAELEALRRFLDRARDIEVPDPGSDYSRRLWEEIEPRLGGRPRSGRSIRSRMGWLAAGVVLIVGAYFVGRHRADVVPLVPPVDIVAERPAPTPEAARRAILELAVSEHFARSARLLREVGNVQVVAAESPIPERARGLLADNRIFRLAAAGAGDAVLDRTLEDLERWLIDVSHLGSDAVALTNIQRRQTRGGLLFRLDVLQTQLGRAGIRLSTVDSGAHDEESV